MMPKGAKRCSGSRIKTQRIGTTGRPECRQTAEADVISILRAPAPYQPGTTSACQGVLSSARTSDKVGNLTPFVRGRPIVPGRRGGAGS